MRFIKERQVCLIPPTGDQTWEVLVGGDPQRPSPACMAMVDTAMRSIEALRQQADEYLLEFVREDHARNLSGWELVGLECGLTPLPHPDQITLVLSNPEDTYGEWSVTLQYANKRSYAVALSRRQI